MCFKNDYFIIFISFFCLACSSSARLSTTEDTLLAKDLKPFGRTILNSNQHLELISSAVHFGFTFTGTNCKVFAAPSYSGAHNYLQYELDGVYQKKLRINGDTSLTISAGTNGKHTVWLYKVTEAHTGAVIIKKVAASAIQAIERPKLDLIEFIGNSITCGAAADPSDIPCNSGEYHDHHNAYYAYGPRVARALNTNFILSSVSGIGIYRNWNSDGPTMPQVYEKADFQENTQATWNFSLYTPKVVSIALGTNDFSSGDGKRKRLPFDSAAFVGAYIQFVQKVKSKYPKAKIALLSSAMVGGTSRNILQNCITAVKYSVDAIHPSDTPVSTYFFQPMTPRGCSGHPNVEDHGIMANQLLPFFRELLEAKSK